MNKFLEEDLQVIAQGISKKFYGKTILITGATGLIGSLIIKSLLFTNKYLKANIQIIAAARSEEKVKDIFNDFFDIGVFKVIYGDITSKIEIIDEIDYIIHAASQTASRELITHPVESMNTAILGTHNILQLAMKKNVKGIVYLSSMEAFGVCSNENSRLEENDLGFIDLTNVRNCYAESKRLCELMCKCYSDEYGLNVKSARLAQVFGVGILHSENRVFAQFVRSAMDNNDIILHTDGTSWGNYCYTTDAIRAIFLILDRGSSGETYTVVNEQNSIQIKDMAQLVIDIINNKKSKVVFDIPNTNLFGYAPKTVMKLSSTKLNRLGWNANISLEEMYRRLILSLGGKINVNEN